MYEREREREKERERARERMSKGTTANRNSFCDRFKRRPTYLSTHCFNDQVVSSEDNENLIVLPYNESQERMHYVIWLEFYDIRSLVYIHIHTNIYGSCSWFNHFQQQQNSGIPNV